MTSIMACEENPVGFTRNNMHECAKLRIPTCEARGKHRVNPSPCDAKAIVTEDILDRSRRWDGEPASYQSLMVMTVIGPVGSGQG